MLAKPDITKQLITNLWVKEETTINKKTVDGSVTSDFFYFLTNDTKGAPEKKNLQYY